MSGGQLSGAIFLGGNRPEGWALYGGNYPRGQLSSGQLSSGAIVRWEIIRGAIIISSFDHSGENKQFNNGRTYLIKVKFVNILWSIHFPVEYTSYTFSIVILISFDSVFIMLHTDIIYVENLVQSRKLLANLLEKFLLFTNFIVRSIFNRYR